jgi:hypothetical protein
LAEPVKYVLPIYITKNDDLIQLSMVGRIEREWLKLIQLDVPHHISFTKKYENEVKINNF